jgi:hypothetical protein
VDNGGSIRGFGDGRGDLEEGRGLFTVGLGLGLGLGLWLGVRGFIVDCHLGLRGLEEG